MWRLYVPIVVKEIRVAILPLPREPRIYRQHPFPALYQPADKALFYFRDRPDGTKSDRIGIRPVFRSDESDLYFSDSQ